MTRLLLLRAATTAQTRRAGFPATSGAAEAPGCAPLDRAGRAAAARLAGCLPRPDRVETSHAARAVETAALAVPGHAALRRADLAGCDVGRWAGRSVQEVAGAEAGALAAWRADPAFDGHGGEARAALTARAAALLDREAARDGATLAVTHGDLVRAVLATVLGAGEEAFWSLEAPPASLAELSWSGSAWRVVRSGWTPTLRGVPDAPAAPDAVPATVATAVAAVAGGRR